MFSNLRRPSEAGRVFVLLRRVADYPLKSQIKDLKTEFHHLVLFMFIKNTGSFVATI